MYSANLSILYSNKEKNWHSARWSFAPNLALSYLAGAKSEALDNIYSLLKQNIKSCYAKRRRQPER